jgi:hypothetical protein
MPTDINIKGASARDIVDLLMQHGALIPGEGGAYSAPGVLFSYIGEAEQGGNRLPGVYAFVGVEDTQFGPGSAAFIAALRAREHPGPPLRVRA